MSSIPIENLDYNGVNAPINLVRRLEDFSPNQGTGASRFRHIYPNGSPLDSLLVSKGSDTLVVSLHGALNRKRFNLPRFERLKSLLGHDVNSMYFTDPTLWLDEKVQLTWFTGWEDIDVQGDIASMISKSADAIGASKIIVTGSSGGGFAALQISALIPESTALAFNPSVVIHGYLVNGEAGSHGTERKYVEVVHPDELRGPNRSFDPSHDWATSKGESVSVIRRYSKPLSNRVIYCQTPTDWHYDQHYLPFLAAAAKGGNLSNVLVYEYGDRIGHFPPSPSEYSKALHFALSI